MTDWIIAVSSLLSASAIVFLWKQAVLLKRQNDSTGQEIDTLRKQIRADHERSRKEKAQKLCLTWSLELEQHSRSAVALVANLDHQACLDIIEEKPIKISGRWKNNLLSCLVDFCDEDSLKKDGNYFLLEESHSARIRYLVVKVLNILESILVSWKHGIADEQIIEEEFSTIVRPKEHTYIVETFRVSLGKRVHPAIEEFIVYLKKNEQPTGIPATHADD